MTRLIAAYHDLGKSTVFRTDRNAYLDVNFYDYPALEKLSYKQRSDYYDACTCIIKSLLDSNEYRSIFIPVNDFVLLRLVSIYDTNKIQVILPDLPSSSSIEVFKKRIILSKGIKFWYNVVEKEVAGMNDKIAQFRKLGFDVRLVKADRYLIDVVSLYDYHRTK